MPDITEKSPAYRDRFGKIITPDTTAIFKSRTGIFAACIARGHMLVTWSSLLPSLAELPGGGIDPGEDPPSALAREIEEETTARIKIPAPTRTLTQDIKFFSEKNNEFWDYHQTYWRLEGATIDTAWFDGERQPEDARTARWVPLAALKNLQFHAIHRQALEKLGLSP